MQTQDLLESMGSSVDEPLQLDGRGGRGDSRRGDENIVLQSFKLHLKAAKSNIETKNTKKLLKNINKDAYLEKILTCEYPQHRGTGTRCAAVCQNPKPYPYPWYPFWKHRGYSRTRVEP